MKKFFAFILSLLLILIGTAACADDPGRNGGGDGGGTVPPDAAVSGVLVAYFSCTGTTEGIAEIIADETGGELHEILPEIPYTAEDLDYYSGGRADREQADPNARPEIANSVEHMEDYGVVFLGYPIWHGRAPKIIYTFLESYDFAGKTVVPFCTSGSSGIGGSEGDLHALAEDAEWPEGRRFSGSDGAQAIRQWLEELNLNIANDVSSFDLGSGEKHDWY